MNKDRQYFFLNNDDEIAEGNIEVYILQRFGRFRMEIKSSGYSVELEKYNNNDEMFERDVKELSLSKKEYEANGNEFFGKLEKMGYKDLVLNCIYLFLEFERNKNKKRETKREPTR